MTFRKTKLEISARIVKARREKGYTQDNLADAIGVKQPAIAQIESGKTMPKLETLMAISKELNRPLADFFPPTVPNRVLGNSLLGLLWMRIQYWWYRRSRNKSDDKAS